MRNKIVTVVSGRSGNLCSEGATPTTGPVPMALTVAATAVTHQRAGQPGRSARSSPPPRYGRGCHLPAGPNEGLKRTVSTVQGIMNMGIVQEE
jgi:hypothetical protein